jgi:hypothetical protein
MYRFLRCLPLFSILWGLLSCPPLFASNQAINLINNFHKKLYLPDSKGLQDLTFEVHLDKIADSIQNAYPNQKIGEVYLKVYWWTFKNKKKVENKRIEILIEGLPHRGVKEVEETLVNIGLKLLKEIIPPPLLQGIPEFYKKGIKFKKTKDHYLVTAEDQQKDINRIEMKFSKNGILQSQDLFFPGQKVTKEFSFQKNPASKGKGELLLSRTLTKDWGKNPSSEVERKVTFEDINNYSLPVKIETTKRLKLKVSKDYKPPKGAVLKKEDEFTTFLTIRNYKVNQNIAKEYFVRKLRASKARPKQP